MMNIYESLVFVIQVYAVLWLIMFTAVIIIDTKKIMTL